MKPKVEIQKLGNPRTFFFLLSNFVIRSPLKLV